MADEIGLPKDFTVWVDMKSTDCPNCGIRFAFNEVKFNALQANGLEFFCPNGHSLRFVPPKKAG